MPPEHPYRSGDELLVRDIFRGRVAFALPSRVVSEDDDRLIIYFAPGTLVCRPRFSERKEFFYLLAQGMWDYEAFHWYNHHLQLTRFSDPYSVALIWNESWTFLGWYINIQEPLRRTAIGFDTFDQVLDVVVSLDRTWRLKDEDELELAQALNLFSAKEVAAIRNAAKEAIDGLDDHPAFDDGWLAWRPEESWVPPTLPIDWELLDGDQDRLKP